MMSSSVVVLRAILNVFVVVVVVGALWPVIFATAFVEADVDNSHVSVNNGHEQHSIPPRCLTII
jgi:hypothetical protein